MISMTASAMPLKKPWYKEPWPWILMSGPAVVVVAGFYTAWLAVVSADGVLDKNAPVKPVAAGNAQKVLQQAEVVIGADQKIRVFFNAGDNAKPNALQMLLTRADQQSEVQAVNLVADGGILTGTAAVVPHDGEWRVVLAPQGHEWRMEGLWRPAHEKTLRLALTKK
jgi:hypothetical protein